MEPPFKVELILSTDLATTWLPPDRSTLINLIAAEELFSKWLVEGRVINVIWLGFFKTFDFLIRKVPLVKLNESYVLPAPL